MRGAFRALTEGSALLALAVFTAALHCALRSLRLRRAEAPALAAPGEHFTPATMYARRPAFLLRRNHP
jgi:hypothetical protein